MISIEPVNRLNVTIEGLGDAPAVLEKPGSSLSLTLVPFMRGEPARWMTLSQADYDALPLKDPQTLYLIVD